ncbi:MAG: hypothetical protein V3T53_09615, partial [Phycisphaerales bacterium]
MPERRERQGTVAMYMYGNPDSQFDDITVTDGGGVVLNENFDDGDMLGWTIVDEGTLSGVPSNWLMLADVVGFRVTQTTNIYGPNFTDIGREGTFAYWDAAPALQWANYTVEATLHTTDNDGVGLMFYYTDLDNYYKVDFDIQRNFYKIFRMLDGQETTLAVMAGTHPDDVDFDVCVNINNG